MGSYEILTSWVKSKEDTLPNILIRVLFKGYLHY